MASSLLEILLYLILVEALFLWQPGSPGPQSKVVGLEANISQGGHWSDGEQVHFLVPGPLYSAYWRLSTIQWLLVRARPHPREQDLNFAGYQLHVGASTASVSSHFTTILLAMSGYTIGLGDTWSCDHSTPSLLKSETHGPRQGYV